ncbi:hypothetical protein AJ79_09117 [Helicocarpus griseus UAMH5409]|uniref:glutamate--tRNA ligase n=1 Tax=Helicocarpus griseus UAMH5409 TaxID=1447875 RepID=A0A2B7WMF0_9EURO|nr:hypothetical protein AJ79_09117 [Helicocarpus griseus UAMH5409]
MELLGIKPDRVSFSSDYFQLMYDLCVKLISSSAAYADDTEISVMRNERRDGIASKNRDMSAADSLAARFAEMKSGQGLQWCIRAKISVDDPNKALRDPVIYRCNLQPHHRTGTTWKVYPTYDFCAPILDSVEEVTYALRTNEYRDRNAQYAWMQNALGLRPVTIWDFSRINFVRTVLSKRKLSLLVEKGAVSGWDDPRMPTVRGIRRRGLTIPALQEFILKQGPSRNVLNFDWSLLWATNKKFIDPTSPRFIAVQKENMVVANIHGQERLVQDKPKRNKNESLATRQVVYSDTILLEQQDAQSFQLNEEVTLMHWGNAFVRQLVQDPTTKLVSRVEFGLHLAGDVKRTSKKITWLSQAQDLVPVQLVDFDHIITKDKLDKEDDIVPHINWNSKFVTEAWADCNVAALGEGDIIQLERKGYYRVDRPFARGEPAVLFYIPTGKA